MIEKTLHNLETKIDQAGLSPAARQDLLKVVKDLKKEVLSLEATHQDEAASIANFSNTLAAEATRPVQDEHLLKLALEGARSSVRRFETTHPVLTSLVNQFCNILAGMGI